MLTFCLIYIWATGVVSQLVMAGERHSNEPYV